MKQTFAILSSLAWLQYAAAACCRSNHCLKALVQADQGTAECSANLVFTFTPEALTVTETTTHTAPGELSTYIGTQLVTVTETFTASTETALATVELTVTASTETELVLTTETVHVSTTETVTVTVTTEATTTDPVVWRRLASSASSAAISSPAPNILPTYAANVCPSWDKYLSACKCLGATPTTITAETPSTTVTVDVISTLPNSLVSSVVGATVTDLAPMTVTTTATQTSTVSVTVTTLTTQTTVLPLTGTETKTTTTQVTSITTAQPTLVTKDVGPFRVNSTDYRGVNLNLYITLNSDGATGNANWGQLPGNTNALVANKYIWKIDSNGHVVLALPIAPYNNMLGLFVNSAPGSTRTMVPQIDRITTIAQRVAAGYNVAWVKGGVDPATKKLYFEAAGRKNLLYCTGVLFLGTGLGEDLVNNPCVLMHPVITPT